MGDQRDNEDEERTRRLEEEIVQGRKERQARRAGMCLSYARAEASSTRDGGSELLLIDFAQSALGPCCLPKMCRLTPEHQVQYLRTMIA